MKHDGGWKRRASRRLFESPWFNLRQDEVSLPGGEQITYTVVENPGYAMVVPLLDDGRVVQTWKVPIKGDTRAALMARSNQIKARQAPTPSTKTLHSRRRARWGGAGGISPA